MVAANTKFHLQRAGVTQTEFAEHFGLSLGSANRRLNGQTALTAAEVIEVSRWIGVDLERFFEPLPQVNELPLSGGGEAA